MESLGLRRAGALSLSLVLALATLATPGGTQEASAEESFEYTLAELLPDSQIYHPDVLAQVMPTSARVETLRSDLSAAMLDAEDAGDRRIDALRRGSEERIAAWSQRVVVDARQDDENDAAAEADLAFGRMGVFAVDSFLGSEEVDLARLTFEGAMSPLPGLTDGASEAIEERYASARAALSHAKAAHIEAQNVAADIAGRLEMAEADLGRAIDDLEDANLRVRELRPQLEQALIGESVPGTDLSLVVIDAYFRASIQMAERRPGCGISWDQLAGVGLIESRHGAFGGSEVGPDGQTSKEILGPVLDGEPFSAIADTDGGVLDGNTEWDRAVGPMQFIPSSWAIYGLDGNADEIADPHNLYDAAFAAAEHLCRGYSDIQNDSVYRRSLLGYNRSTVYGTDVMAARDRYAAAVSLQPTAEGIAEDLARQGIEAAALTDGG